IRHDRGGGPAHGAADGVVGDVLDPCGAVGGQLQAQGDLIPAGGVDVMDLGAERLAQPRVQGSLVVLDDELGVQGGERTAHVRDPKNSTVWATPATKASTSAAVVCTEKLARVVPCRSKRRCSGQAQWWPTRTWRPRESSPWPTSCGCRPGMSKETAPVRCGEAAGPMTRAPSMPARPRSACWVRACSWAAMRSMPRESR